MDPTTKFILMLVLEIPAIILSIVIIVYFAMDRQARTKPTNHALLVLIISNLFQLIFDLPMTMNYYHVGTVWPASNAYCLWWIWCEYSVTGVGLFLMAWISLERHILIFHLHVTLQVPWKRWLFHFAPIVFCVIWTPIFYFVNIIISPDCTNQWNFSFLFCGMPCYFTINILLQFDFILDILIPILIIMLANVALVLRVICQKLSRHQAINWRRQRKMVLQLWVVASLYMGFVLPGTTVQFIQLTVMPSFMIDQMETLAFIIYFVPLLLPMVCLGTLPELVKKIMNIFPKRQLNSVGAVPFNRGVGRSAAVAIVP